MSNTQKALTATINQTVWPVRKKELSHKAQWQILILALLFFDGLMIWSSLRLAYAIRITSGLLQYNGPDNLGTYELLVLVSVPIWLIVFALLGLYRHDNLLGGVIEYKQIFKACITGVIIIILITYNWRDLVLVSRVWLYLSFVLSCLFVILERFIARRIVYLLRRNGLFTSRVLIVGANELGIAIARQWGHSPTSGMKVVGFADDFKPVGTPVTDTLEVVGQPTHLQELAAQLDVSEVVLLPNAVARETFEELISLCNTPKPFALRISPGFYEMLTTSVAVSNKTFVPLFSIHETRIIGIDAFLKGLMDYGLGTFLFVLSLFLTFPVAILMKMKRPTQPVLARYHTIGLSGSRFRMLKLNSYPIGQPGAFWLDNMLLRTGLDKLPQLLNVLRGQMSLVGPRPRTLIGDAPNGHDSDKLLTVKPGIIGPWIPEGIWTTSSETQNEIYYVHNWTIWLDLQIAFTTLLTLLTTGRRLDAIELTEPDPDQPRSEQTSDSPFSSAIRSIDARRR